VKIPTLVEAKKAYAALAAAVAEAVSLGLLNGTAERWTTRAIAVVGAALVYYLPNSPVTPPAPPA
jgi:hypothetical protein